MSDEMEIFSNDLKDIVDDESKDIFNLEITTTEKCNCRCSYCFEGLEKERISVSYDINKLFNLIDYILSSSLYDKLNIGLWGGEPTLEFDFIKQLLDKYASNENVYWFFYTNGLIKDNLIKICDLYKQYNAKERVTFQLSWDGDPLHDKHRLTATGEATSEKVKEMFKYLYNDGFTIDFKATIIPKDFKYMYDCWLSYKEFLEDFFGDKPYNLQYCPTIDQKYNGLSDYVEDFKESIAKILADEEQYLIKHHMPLLSWVNKTMHSCGHRQANCCIDCKGDAYTCHGVLYNDEVKKYEYLGNLDNIEWVNEVLENKNEEIIIQDECKKCPATHCAVCNVENSSISNKTDIREKWYDRTNIPSLCKYYQIFGYYNMAFNSILSLD